MNRMCSYEQALAVFSDRKVWNELDSFDAQKIVCGLSCYRYRSVKGGGDAQME